jgi:hypothetical protein
MYRQIFLALMLCLSMLTYSSFTAQISANAQTRQRPKQKGKKPQKESAAPEQKPAPADPDAEKRKKLDTAIKTACQQLNKTIIDANAYSVPKPFDALTPRDRFQDACTTDGTLVWKAVRYGESDGNPAETQFALWVTVKVTDLVLGDLKATGGKVDFRTDDKEIYVYGPTMVNGKSKNMDEYVDTFYIKLREMKFASAFMENVRTLVASLNARAQLTPIA